MSNRSLVDRVTFTFLYWAAASFAAAVLGLWWGNNFFLEENLIKEARQIAPDFDELGTSLYFSEKSAAIERVRQHASHNPNILSVKYFNWPDMKMLGEYAKKEGTAPLQRKDINPNQTEPVILASHVLGIVSGIRIVTPVKVRSMDSGNLLDMDPNDRQTEASKTIGYLAIDMDLDPNRQIMLRSMMALGFLLAAIATAAFFMGRKNIRQALDPLLNLQEPLSRLAEGNFEVKVVTDKADKEIATIGSALGATIAALQQRDHEKEEALRGKLSAEAASQTKSQFLAHMSHEIRTPLNGLIGFLNLLAKTKLDETQGSYLHTIEISANTLLTVINDILDFSKIEAGKLSIENIPLDLREVIEDAVSLHSPNADQKELGLVIPFNRNVPTKLMGDPGRIGQVVSNLVSNAIKFTDRGEIVVHVSLAEESSEFALISVEVKDSGIGISPEGQKRLFTPFSQADDSTTRRFGGTGLGLVISKKIVEMMEGEISVNSIQGIGSNFRFTMKLKKQTEIAEKTTSHRLRVLAISPNSNVSRCLEENLAAWRMRSHIVTNGKDALGHLDRAAQAGEPYDAVIVDNTIKDMTPASFAEAVKSSEHAASLILLAPPSDRASFDIWRKGKFGPCLGKPPRSSELFNTLSHSLENNHGEESRDKISAAKTMQVLIVDDHEINRKLACILLESMGAKVDLAENGVEGVACCLREEYDMVLMDINMPIMDGIEATARIRELEGDERRTPIIALTANALTGDKERFIQAGMDDYLPKPLNEKALSAVIAKWCRNENPGEETVVEAETEPGERTLPVIDRALGIECAFGNAEIWKTALGIMLDDLPDAMQKINAAFYEKNIEDIRQLSHKLSGASSYCGIPALQYAAKSLELACMNTPNEIEAGLEKLNAAASALLDFIEKRGIPEA